MDADNDDARMTFVSDGIFSAFPKNDKLLHSQEINKTTNYN